MKIATQAGSVENNQHWIESQTDSFDLWSWSPILTSVIAYFLSRHFLEARLGSDTFRFLFPLVLMLATVWIIVRPGWQRIRLQTDVVELQVSGGPKIPNMIRKFPNRSVRMIGKSQRRLWLRPSGYWLPMTLPRFYKGGRELVVTEDGRLQLK